MDDSKIEIIFKVGGRTVNLDELLPIERLTVEVIEEGIREILGPMRCPVHGEAPSIVVSGPSVDQLTGIHVGESCCDEFRSVVEARIQEITEGSVDS